MSFIRHYTATADVDLRLYQIGDPEFETRDPCLNCQLPICVYDRGTDECEYVLLDAPMSTETKVEATVTLDELRELKTDPDARLKRDLIEILQALVREKNDGEV